MKKLCLVWVKLFFLFLILLVSSNSFADQAEIDRIINKYGSSFNIGVFVQSLSSGKIVYQRNAEQLMMPASSLKIFTAAAALSYLGENYKFETKLLANNTQVVQGILKSDVYLYFSGDPTLTKENLNELLLVLKKAGINKIEGNFYLDNSAFDDVPYGPGWMWDERNFSYAAPLSAIIIDKNVFPITIRPARNINQPANIECDPDYNFLPIINNILTERKSLPLTLNQVDQKAFVFSGCLPIRSEPISLAVSLRDINDFAKKTILVLLQKNNISLAGEIKIKPLSSTQTTLLVTHQSEPLAAIVKTMMKKSDNMIADALYKKLPSVLFQKPGAWEDGVKAIALILKNSGVNFHKVKMVDGAGLSRENLVTPYQLTLLLKHVLHNETIKNPFFAALPISGVDDHLQYRMTKIKGAVHAKTGTMKNISSLAGYIANHRGENYVFAIIINNFLEHPAKYQKLEDEICEYLVRT
jgi:serine-type D-Ala-D-Ala carboxypeptidase/endopeptidase (penicillin-binding protein 4)